MSKPSHADMRAWLTVLILREGGAIEISNAELYNAMMPSGGSRTGRFTVEETADGVRVSLSLDADPSA
ncbi:hypothetical protein [Actinomadura sp. HBU206391]|uniref:hypothetical protein n=1 Tax=Actinomadura sp. HBU206391 TaxID=2731692 RepID=UPI00164FCE71|nr:hypothetical protein [Actinomadura sp. HBU206391]MBC6460321.1 hypothetical protein [Actinomadura sp. HBU206391]